MLIKRKITIQEFKDIIAKNNRTYAGISAPAQGLYLVKIYYPQEIFNGIFLRLSPNLRMLEMSDLFGANGFKEIVSEKITYKVFYNNVFNILSDIKGTGENNFLINRQKGMMTKNYVKKLHQIYKKNFGGSEGLELSCDIVSIIGWKNTL